MDATDPNLIFYPVFAMFLLTLGVVVRLAVLRFGAVSRGEVDPRYYVTYDQGTEPPQLRQTARHFSNLFEMPVLFYVGALFAHVAGVVDGWMLALAWTYVAARGVHAWVHLTTNTVIVRFRVFMAAGLVLLAYWMTPFFKIALAG